MPFLRVCIIFISICCILFLFFISNNNKREYEQKKLKIVCTTSMIADSITHVAGDKVELYCLMGPGVDPHLYRPTQGDMHLLAEAMIIFYNGLHLEGKMADLLERMGTLKPTYAVSTAIPKQHLLTAYSQNIFDPHIWHDVTLWMDVIRYIQNILQNYDPDNYITYKNNAEKYLEKLQNLHNYVKIEIQKIPEKQRILITAHDAFRYFGKSYGIRVEGLQGTSTDSEINTRDIQKLADFIVQHALKAIFVESSVPHRSIQALQQAVHARGWNVVIGPNLYSDALADNDSESTYYGMIHYNVNAIVTALR